MLDILLVATKVSGRAAWLVEILAVRKAALMAGKKAVKMVLWLVDEMVAWRAGGKVGHLAE